MLQVVLLYCRNRVKARLFVAAHCFCGWGMALMVFSWAIPKRTPLGGVPLGIALNSLGFSKQKKLSRCTYLPMWSGKCYFRFQKNHFCNSKLIVAVFQRGSYGIVVGRAQPFDLIAFGNRESRLCTGSHKNNFF